MALARTSVNNPVNGLLLMSEQREVMAALVAAGISYRKAAERAGFAADSGWDIMQDPRMQDRVRSLASDPIERVRAGIDADIMIIRRRLAEGDIDAEERATIDLRIKALMAHAKLRGWIIDRKQTQRVPADLSQISPEDLSAHLAGALDVLEPGARRAIEDRLKAVGSMRKKAKAIAAGKTVTVTAEAVDSEQ